MDATKNFTTTDIDAILDALDLSHLYATCGCGPLCSTYDVMTSIGKATVTVSLDTEYIRNKQLVHHFKLAFVYVEVDGEKVKNEELYHRMDDKIDSLSDEEGYFMNLHSIENRFR